MKQTKLKLKFLFFRISCYQEGEINILNFFNMSSNTSSSSLSPTSSSLSPKCSSLSPEAMNFSLKDKVIIHIIHIKLRIVKKKVK